MGAKEFKKVKIYKDKRTGKETRAVKRYLQSLGSWKTNEKRQNSKRKI